MEMTAKCSVNESPVIIRIIKSNLKTLNSNQQFL